MAQLELKNIVKIYNQGKPNETIALRNISLNIEQGDMCAIQGTSGAGKSTLLNIMGCLDTPSSGLYKFCDKELCGFSDKKLANMRNSYFGHVLQNYGLINSLSVYDNIKVPLVFSKFKPNRFRDMILNSLEQVNMSGFEKKCVGELSGGQAQRVAIARALVTSPQIIFADEPTGAIDNENTNKIMKLFQQINQRGVTIIIVTHDDLVANFCNRKIVMLDGNIIHDSAIF